MTKKVLKIDYDYSFSLLGIISPMKDYRLAHFMNKALELELIRQELDIEVPALQGLPPNYIPYYSYWVEESETEYYFFPNKGTEACLIPELRDINFFLMQSPHNKAETDDMLYRLNQIERISKALRIEPSNLKSKENLLLF